MKNIAIILLLFFAAVPFGCQKNEFKIDSDTTCSPVAVGSREPLPVLTVADGMLVFASIEQYNQVRALVRTSTKADLMAWQLSLNFKSMQYYYQEAIGQICCPDAEVVNMPAIAANYQGKVLYNAEEQDINPLLPIVTTGWLLNTNGEFRVGPSLIHYTNNNVISVVDGSTAKMTAAVSNPVENANIGVYVHPLVVSAPEAGCCPWNLNAPSVSTGNSNGSKRIKTAWVTNWDESFVAHTNLGDIYSVIFTYAGYFHHQRKSWGLWLVCQRTQWKYKAGETATLINIPPNCGCLPPGFVNPKIINIPLNTSANECKLNFEREVFGILNVTPAVYNVLDLCVQNISVETKALDSNLSTSNHCN